MQEKNMVSDVLSMTKASMDSYAKAIACCSNQQLRSALQQLRDEAEKFQYDLGQKATQLGYYQPSEQASQQSRQQVKSKLSQGMTNSTQGNNSK